MTAVRMVAHWKPWDGGEMVAHATLLNDSWWVTNVGTGKTRKVGSQDATYGILMKLNRPKNHGGEYNTVRVDREAG